MAFGQSKQGISGPLSILNQEMSTALERTGWPDTPIEPEVKDLIALFFRLVDLSDNEAGRQLAEDVFTADGNMITANGAFDGEAGASPVLAKRPRPLGPLPLTKGLTG